MDDRIESGELLKDSSGKLFMKLSNGEIFDFGNLQFNSQQLSGVGNATRGVYAMGYAYPNMSPVSTNSVNMHYTMITHCFYWLINKTVHLLMT